MAIVTLNTLVDLYKTDKFGNQKIVKRNVECKKTFDTNLILVEQYITQNGKISNKWCSIKDGDNYYRVAHTFDYVQNLITPKQIEFNGFKYNNKTIIKNKKDGKSKK